MPAVPTASRHRISGLVAPARESIREGWYSSPHPQSSVFDRGNPGCPSNQRHRGETTDELDELIVSRGRVTLPLKFQPAQHVGSFHIHELLACPAGPLLMHALLDGFRLLPGRFALVL